MRLRTLEQDKSLNGFYCAAVRELMFPTDPARQLASVEVMTGLPWILVEFRAGSNTLAAATWLELVCPDDCRYAGQIEGQPSILADILKTLQARLDGPPVDIKIRPDGRILNVVVYTPPGVDSLLDVPKVESEMSNSVAMPAGLRLRLSQVNVTESAACKPFES